MKKYVVLILLAVSFYGSAQYNINVEAFLLDQETNLPITFANIGFNGKAIGTVSGDDGKFTLVYDESKIKDTDILTISRLGYETLSFTAEVFYNKLVKTNKIYLQPISETLDEVVVEQVSRTKKILGYTSFHGHYLMAYWKDEKALGAEIGTYIKVRKKNTKLNKLSFQVIDNTADSLLVRVNVYDVKKGNPVKNVLTSNIYHTISKKKGVEEIDLSPYNIVVDKSCIISLELIKVYGDAIEFAIVAGGKGKSYLRYISHDVWRELPQTGVAFKIEASYPDTKENEIKREGVQRITLYWDTSLSMKNRLLVKELELLEKYFKNLKNVTVDVIPFSSNVRSRKTFEITKGNSDKLLEYLSELTYNGGSNFESLFKDEVTPDVYIVSTDGLSTFGKLSPQYSIPTFFINSKADGDHLLLQDSGQFSEGHYINLATQEVKKSLEHMILIKSDDQVYSKDKRYESIKGQVLANDIPLEACYVTVKGTLRETETDANGEFDIRAKVGDVLEFAHFGTDTIKRTITSLQALKINLNLLYNPLDEIEIQVKGKDTLDNEQTKVSGLSRSRGQGASYTLTEDEFPKSAVYISDLIRNRFPGVQVLGSGNEAKYRVRGFSSFYNIKEPLWVVDGVQSVGAPAFLQPSLIKSISLLSSLAFTARYGAAGANGVFIVETKMGARNGSFGGTATDSLLVKGNDYKEAVVLVDETKNRPEYLTKLWNSTSYKEAKDNYFRLLKYHSNQVPFYLYCSSYFERWDKDFAKEIISSIAEVAEDNYKAFRTLAFKLEQLNEIDQALLIYEKLKELRPKYPQSFLDLARIYTIKKKYKEAYDLYAFMTSESNDLLDTEYFSEQLLSQFNNFLNNHRAKISDLNVPKEYLKVRSVPVRLVFDWNDPQSEFEVQFVNPKKKYFTWVHNSGNSTKERTEEQRKGVLSKEFIVDTSFSGEWIVNVKSLNTTINPNIPTFMKYTVYKNYGLANETKEVKFLNLYNQKEKVTLDKFTL